MLNCDLCDYYKTIPNEGKTGEVKAPYCEFSGFVFVQGPGDLDIEYPCRDISYDEYLQRSQKELYLHKNIDIDKKIVYIKSDAKPAAAEEKISA